MDPPLSRSPLEQIALGRFGSWLLVVFFYTTSPHFEVDAVCVTQHSIVETIGTVNAVGSFHLVVAELILFDGRFLASIDNVLEAHRAFKSDVGFRLLKIVGKCLGRQCVVANQLAIALVEHEDAALAEQQNRFRLRPLDDIGRVAFEALNISDFEVQMIEIGIVKSLDALEKAIEKASVFAIIKACVAAELPDTAKKYEKKNNMNCNKENEYG